MLYVLRLMAIVFERASKKNAKKEEENHFIDRFEAEAEAEKKTVNRLEYT